MKNNKKGFTLIELLSVIVILAIIALIAVPTIVNISNKAKQSAFKDTAYSLVNAADLYFASQQLDFDEIEEDKTFNLPEDANTEDGLQIKGKIPTGVVTITADGKVSIAVQKGKYCAQKGFEETEVTVTKNIKSCIPPVSITAMTLTSSSELSLTAGKTSKIGVNIEPSEATNKKLNYSLDKEGIVTVSETGLITAVKAGTVKITVSTTDGSNISKIISVTVKQSVEGLSLGVTSLAFNANETYQIIPTITPNNAENKTLTYSSNNTSVATVSTTGLITAVKAGTAKITVSTTDGSNISKTISVTVKQSESGTYTNGIMQSTNNCINVGTCPNGTLVKVAVNNQQSYDFYTIKDNGNNLTLIMSENLGNDVAWNTSGDATDGPITVLDYLDGLTDDEWSNVPKKDYKYSGLSYNAKQFYEDITRNMRARIITYREQSDLGCTISGGCPSYLFGDYWTSTAHFSNDGTRTSAWTVTAYGRSNYVNVSNHYYGIRPVIELSK